MDQPPTAVVPTDADLLVAIAGRDQAALATLYDRHGALAYRVAYHLLGDHGQAEDVVQDVFLAVWRRAASFEPERGSGRGWLLTAVHHRAVSLTRGVAGRVRGDLPLDVARAVPAVDDILATIAGRERADLIADSFAVVSTVQREALELAYFGGLSCREIAGVTGVSIGTVKGRLRLGLLKLRAELDPTLAAD